MRTSWGAEPNRCLDCLISRGRRLRRRDPIPTPRRRERESLCAGNPRGKPPGSRNRFSRAFILAMTTDFELYGARVVERVRRSYPAVYLKVCAMLMPRELHVQGDPISKLTDEQLDE